MTWKSDDPQGDEASKIRWELVEYTNGRGLDLGCGQFKAFPHFTGVDNGHHWGMKGVDVHVDTCENLDIFASDSMDFIFSSHLLEHIANYKVSLKEWFRVLKVGGRLVLYLPHKELYPNIGEKGANPDHKNDFMPDDIIGAMKEVGGWDLVRNETRAQDREYSFFQVYTKAEDDEHKFSCNDPKPAKTCCVVRYGAFGDLIQASSLLPLLKADGYHITFNTTEAGYSIIKHDPNIDKFIIQGKDQVPNHALPAYWEGISKNYDKFVNLSESVEGSLLAIPGRTPHTWPKNLRHKMLNVNYNEFAHDLAGLPTKIAQKFHPTAEEKLWAQAEYKKIGGKVIVWSLAGSAIHKTWPHLDTIIARLMIQHKTVKVVLVGDELCKLLEQGWEKEPRVICKSGQWSIRESITFSIYADLVIGSETGLLNAVGMEEVQKIVTLSHSSIENLTKHWKNTQSIEPKTSCYPCHQMHYNFDHCKRDESSGVAQCQADITPDEVYAAIEKVLR